jgi:hypothetical protein
MAADPVKRISHEPPRITILSDHPAQDRGKGLHDTEAERLADRDLLKLDTRLGTVFDVLRHKNTRCPLTVAINGPWGTGKTSAMRWLQTRLDEWNNLDESKRDGHPAVRTVWFDPWRYRSREDVWKGIIAEVILAAIRPPACGECPDRLGLIREGAKKFGGFLGDDFLAVLEEWEAKFKLPLLDTVLSFLKLTRKTVAAIRKAYGKREQPEKAYLNEFEAALRDWVERCTRSECGCPPDRIAIFIDDLDRCLPAVTLEVLEALKLYLNIPSLIFVAGLDRDVVDGIIRAHYESNKLPADKARSYLDKLFQVTVRIPAGQRRMAGFFDAQVTALDEANGNLWSKLLKASQCLPFVEDTLRTLSDNNPRDVKRLLNSAIERGRGPAYDPDLGGDDKADDSTRGLLFAQGIQVFLLQHWFWLKQADPDRMFMDNMNLEWFRVASEKVRTIFEDGTAGITDEEELCTRLRALGEIWLPERGTGGGLEKKPDDAPGRQPLEATAGPTFTSLTPPPPPPPPDTEAHKLARHLSTRPGAAAEKPGDTEALWLRPVLWRILRITFNPAVAGSAPRLESAAKTAGNVASFLTACSPEFRNRLARAAEVPPDALNADHLGRIRELTLRGIPLSATDVSLLAGLTLLERLYLDGTQIGDVKALSGLTKLKLLDLSALPVSDVSALTGLSELTSLSLDLTEVSDVRALATLSQLRLLGLRRTKVSDVSPLAGLAQLEELLLDGTQVRDISRLAGLTQLKSLSLNGTQVSREQVAELQKALPELQVLR